MAIKRIPLESPLKLPAANLYIDDIEEIVRIFKSPTHSELTTTFVVNNQECDTIEDLRQIGGRTRKFEMSVEQQTKGDYRGSLRDQIEIRKVLRPYIYLSGSPQRQSWIKEQIYDVFSSRVSWYWIFRKAIVVGFLAAFAGCIFLWNHLPISQSSISQR